MSEVDVESQIAGARAYESLFVPALFGQWTDLVSRASKVSEGNNVLDVACGTGVLSRSLHKLVTDSGSVTGLDPNIGMLTVAAERDCDINWKQGIAESLPFEAGSFDAVVSQFGLMFFDNPKLAISEFLRVVKPNGTIVVGVWDSIENIPGYKVEHALIEKLAGSRAADAVAAPFSMGNKAKLKQLFIDSGSKNIAIETHSGVARFPDIGTMVNAELRGWLPIMGVDLEEEVIKEILDEAEKEMSQFNINSGDVEFAVSAHIVVVTG